ncbi:hypothetical protein Trydic_g14880 [Trypoxylus dichotomus]
MLTYYKNNSLKPNPSKTQDPPPHPADKPVYNTQKVGARNNTLRKLTNSKWGSKPKVVRTTAVGLYFSTCPMWSKSHADAGKVDVNLNETCRLVTGCMEPAPLAKLYPTAVFSSPSSRREAHEFNERFKRTIATPSLTFSTDPGG